ncbi:MAG: hypothetical protein IPN29_02065 [Saprospiraceae bacterium]|nr:hypothetical protein [Saprospiraceae bacterium]
MLGLIYFFPGFWKLWNGGFDWIFTLNLTKQLYVKWGEMNGWLPSFRIDTYPVLIVICSIIVIGFELGFIFLCIKKKCRPVLLLTGVVMHSGIYVLMNISFFALLPNYVVLVDWARLFRVSSNTLINSSSGIPYSKSLRTIAIILLGGNMIYGLKKQQSYPFTCYPTFDYMVPDSMYFISYAGIKDGLVVLSHKGG